MAILSMDAYNRGYGAGIGSGTDGLSTASDRMARIGDAAIRVKNLANAGMDAVAQAAGFHAIAYEWSGQTVISDQTTDEVSTLNAIAGRAA
jgi:hypothetical protein